MWNVIAIEMVAIKRKGDKIGMGLEAEFDSIKVHIILNAQGHNTIPIIIA